MAAASRKLGPFEAAREINCGVLQPESAEPLAKVPIYGIIDGYRDAAASVHSGAYEQLIKSVNILRNGPRDCGILGVFGQQANQPFLCRFAVQCRTSGSIAKRISSPRWRRNWASCPGAISSCCMFCRLNVCVRTRPFVVYAGGNDVPSESTFSRAFAESDLPARLHAELIKEVSVR